MAFLKNTISTKEVVINIQKIKKVHESKEKDLLEAADNIIDSLNGDEIILLSKAINKPLIKAAALAQLKKMTN